MFLSPPNFVWAIRVKTHRRVSRSGHELAANPRVWHASTPTTRSVGAHHERERPRPIRSPYPAPCWEFEGAGSPRLAPACMIMVSAYTISEEMRMVEEIIGRLAELSWSQQRRG